MRKQLLLKFSLIGFILLLLFSIQAKAQTDWQSLGPDDFNRAAFSSAEFISVAFNSQNEQYVFFKDRAEKDYGTVRKFNGTKWEDVGAPGFTGVDNSNPTCIIIDNNDVPYVAYLGGVGNKITVKKFDGNAWVTVGDFDLNGHLIHLSLKLDQNGIIYLGYLKQNEIEIKSFDGNTWTDLPSPGIDYFYLVNNFIELDRNGVLHVISNQNNKPLLKKYNGTRWDEIDISSINYQLSFPSFSFDSNNNLYITDIVNDSASVMMYNGTNWSTVSSKLYLGGYYYYYSLQLDSNNIPYFSYLSKGKTITKKIVGGSWVDVYTSIQSDQGNFYFPVVLDKNDKPVTITHAGTAIFKKFNGVNWEYLGTPGITPGWSGNPSIAYDQSGILYIAISDSENNYKASVKRFVNNEWSDVGQSLISAGQAMGIKLVFDNNNTPYIAYQDESNDLKCTVKKLIGNTWANVGLPGFSDGVTENINLVIDANGTPIISYWDKANNYRTTIKKFNGSSWVDIGAVNNAFNSSLAISKYGVPYIAFMDASQESKASVMKFDGNSWNYVGSPGFSDGWSDFISLVIDNNGMPIVAYYNRTIPNKGISVKKFDGNSWIDISANLPAKSYPYLSLILNENDTPYLAYQNNIEDRKSNKANVVRFDGANWVHVGSPDFSAGDAWAINMAIYNNKLAVAYANIGTFVKSIDIETGYSESLDKLFAEVFPNPACDEFYLKLKNLEQQKVTVTLLNPIGQAIRSYEIDTHNGEAYTRFQTAGMVKGLYLVKITDGEKIISQKLLIQ